jgi:hypothetical protein
MDGSRRSGGVQLRRIRSRTPAGRAVRPPWMCDLMPAPTRTKLHGSRRRVTERLVVPWSGTSHMVAPVGDLRTRHQFAGMPPTRRRDAPSSPTVRSPTLWREPAVYRRPAVRREADASGAGWQFTAGRQVRGGGSNAGRQFGRRAGSSVRFGSSAAGRWFEDEQVVRVGRWLEDEQVVRVGRWLEDEQVVRVGRWLEDEQAVRVGRQRESAAHRPATTCPACPASTVVPAPRTRGAVR